MGRDESGSGYRPVSRHRGPIADACAHNARRHHETNAIVHMVGDVHKAVDGALRTVTRRAKGHFIPSAVTKARTVVSRQQSDLALRRHGADDMRHTVRDRKAAAEERDGAARVHKSRRCAESINV